MIDALLDATRALLDLPAGTDLEAVLHPGSRGEEGFVSFFVYRDGEPLCIAKVPRGDDANTEAEAASLEAALDPVRDTPLANTLDRALALESVAGRKVLFKSFRQGRPATQALAGRAVEALDTVRTVGTWWCDYVAASKPHHVHDRAAKAEAVRALIALVPGAVEDAPWVRAFVDDPRTFLGPTHGDLVPANVLMHGGRVDTVIDLENFDPHGFPEADLIGWLGSCASKLSGRRPSMLEDLWLDGGAFAGVVRDVVRTYVDRTGTDVEGFVDRLPLYSHRALAIAAAWGMERETVTHRRLLEDFLRHRDALRTAWSD